MNKPTYKIYTLGCKVNQCDSREIGRSLEVHGFIKAGKDADLAVINTCCVTKPAIRKDRKIIQKAKKENPQASIVVMGCWPSVYGEDCIEADLVWKTGNLDELVSRIIKNCAVEYSFKRNTVADCQRTLDPDETLERCRYMLKIQDGCEQFCSYCAIPYARGKYKSRPEQEIIKEARAAIGQGFKEIVLCGIHLGKYGHENVQSAKCKVPQFSKLWSAGSRKSAKRCGIKSQNERNMKNPECSNLEELLIKMVRLKGLGRIRLSSIEMNEVTDGLIGLIRDSGKICKHLHIPLQSGSDKILKLMNRPYTAEEFLKRIMAIKASIPDISITTDIIVGFPAEADDDFRQTCELAEKAAFSRLHVFTFSGHEKTPAYNFLNKIDTTTMAKRSVDLKKLGLKLERKYRSLFKSQKMEIVVEHLRGDKIIGKTEFYFDVAVSPDKIQGYSTAGPKDLLEVQV